MRVTGPMKNGQLATSSTRAALSATSWPMVKGVTIIADAANSAPIFIGDSTVTTANGLKLAAGAIIQNYPASDLKDVYVVSAAAQAVSFSGG